MPAHATAPQQTVGLLVCPLPLAHSASDAVLLFSGHHTLNKPKWPSGDTSDILIPLQL
ncbi:hypothetical protein I79_008275 [Cricetulus griseus]|uniref:Uncharacterized protein n=1 Tax=Cricetulus griseus TaxID=10029 RepID=G3HCR1_CRIGR|nr:hypothetical protein I79_008275 [Cricetulus griseus]